MCEFMKQALLLAKRGGKEGEVPVGAVVVKDGKIVSKAYNTREKTQNALCHAEIVAIERACKKLHSFRLSDCALYVTLEPCPMCTGAIINARVGQVFVGCKDKDFGCCGGKTNLAGGDFGFAPQVTFGIMEKECKALLDQFFVEIRNKNKLKKLLGKFVEVCHTTKSCYCLTESGKILCVVDISFSPCENKNLKTVENKEQTLKDNCKKERKSTEKVFAIIDELQTGKIYFVCKEIDENDLKIIIKQLNLRGRIKIFKEKQEPIILDVKKLTEGVRETNI